MQQYVDTRNNTQMLLLFRMVIFNIVHEDALMQRKLKFP